MSVVADVSDEERTRAVGRDMMLTAVIVIVVGEEVLRGRSELGVAGESSFCQEKLYLQHHGAGSRATVVHRSPTSASRATAATSTQI